MIGLGKWECYLNTVFFKGKAQMEILNKNGEYAFKFYIDGSSVSSYKITSISEYNGDTLIIQGFLNRMPNKKITASLKFTDEKTCVGEIKAPILGTVKVDNIYKTD